MWDWPWVSVNIPLTDWEPTPTNQTNPTFLWRRVKVFWWPFYYGRSRRTSSSTFDQARAGGWENALCCSMCSSADDSPYAPPSVHAGTSGRINPEPESNKNIKIAVTVSASVKGVFTLRCLSAALTSCHYHDRKEEQFIPNVMYIKIMLIENDNRSI